MRCDRILFLASLIASLGIGVAHGKECEGVSFPEQVEFEGSTLKLNGLGLRQATFLMVDVYVAGLYVAQTSTDANAILGASAPKQLTLHFVRDVGRADLVGAWDEGFESNARSQLPALRDRVEAFKGLMGDVTTGQRLRFVHRPGAGIEVDVDGKVAGKIAGDDFAHALFSIWLGSHPPNAGLKAGLLGEACQ